MKKIVFCFVVISFVVAVAMENKEKITVNGKLVEFIAEYERESLYFLDVFEIIYKNGEDKQKFKNDLAKPKLIVFTNNPENKARLNAAMQVVVDQIKEKK